MIEHHEARRWSIPQWEPALRERFDRDVEAFVGARRGQHAPLFDAAFHRAWRAEVIGFAYAHFGILRDADAPADRIVRRLREDVAEYRADWTALTSGRSPAETLEEVGMSELLGRAAGLENLPNMGAIVMAFSRCENQLEVCRALVAEGRRDGG